MQAKGTSVYAGRADGGGTLRKMLVLNPGPEVSRFEFIGLENRASSQRIQGMIQLRRGSTDRRQVLKAAFNAFISEPGRC